MIINKEEQSDSSKEAEIKKENETIINTDKKEEIKIIKEDDTNNIFEEQKEEIKIKKEDDTNNIIDEQKEAIKIKKEDDNNNIIEEQKDEINSVEIEKKKLKLILKAANEDMTKKDYKKAEDKYHLILETENKDVLESVKENMIDILINYSLSLYYQMKYEESSKILYNLIVNYDSKNKEAYLLFLKILCDINEYGRAKLLLEKANKIFDINKNELVEFIEINNEIEKYFKIKNNNIQRQFYYNAEKEIFILKNNLNFFRWCFYSFVALLIGNYLSKLLV